MYSFAAAVPPHNLPTPSHHKQPTPHSTHPIRPHCTPHTRHTVTPCHNLTSSHAQRIPPIPSHHLPHTIPCSTIRHLQHHPGPYQPPPPPTPIPLHITPTPGPPSRSKGSLGATCASWTCARSIKLDRFRRPQSWTTVAIIRDHHSHHHPPRPQGPKSIKLHPRTPATNPSHKPSTAQPRRRAPTP